jgi:hypothetical protein
MLDKLDIYIVLINWIIMFLLLQNKYSYIHGW